PTYPHCATFSHAAPADTNYKAETLKFLNS
ncbi:MAG: hypothetical protein ACI8ZW_000323, partial [Yoonia sp.]